MNPRKRKDVVADGFKKAFAERLKKLREKKGLTVQQLADQSGVTHGTIHRWENGENSPVSEKLFAVAEVLETSVSSLLKAK